MSFFKSTAGFKLSNYDCIGFDLDNTLCEYYLYELCNLEYDLLRDKLIQNGYNFDVLSKPLYNDLDFIRRGLILDIDRGNVLDIVYDGTIIKASHGTRILSTNEVIEIYGRSRHWDVTDTYIKNFMATWNGPLSQKMRATLDYFDIVMPLVFGRVVDGIDAEHGQPMDHYKKIFEHLLDTLYEMYSREHFEKHYGGYFPALKSEPTRYVKTRSSNFLNWLRKIKEEKVTFLITGSNVDYANLVAETSIGKDWKQYFDQIVYYARKPGFFCGNRPFLKVDNEQETNIICMELNDKDYSQGNWTQMYEVLKRKTGKDKPSCLYIGDNLIQDTYSPVHCLGLDTVVVAREMSDEMVLKTGSTLENEGKYTSSLIWGSYFKNEYENKLTVWGNIICKYSKLCIPDVNLFADKPLDFEYSTFDPMGEDKKNIKGYFPHIPDSLKS